MIEVEDTYELEELREAARIGSIYHSNNLKFKRNKNLSEVMHVVLHLCQFVRNLFNLICYKIYIKNI